MHRASLAGRQRTESGTHETAFGSMPPHFGSEGRPAARGFDEAWAVSTSVPPRRWVVLGRSTRSPRPVDCQRYRMHVLRLSVPFVSGPMQDCTARRRRRKLADPVPRSRRITRSSRQGRSNARPRPHQRGEGHSDQWHADPHRYDCEPNSGSNVRPRRVARGLVDEGQDLSGTENTGNRVQAEGPTSSGHQPFPDHCDHDLFDMYFFEQQGQLDNSAMPAERQPTPPPRRELHRQGSHPGNALRIPTTIAADGRAPPPPERSAVRNADPLPGRHQGSTAEPQGNVWACGTTLRSSREPLEDVRRGRRG